MKNATQFLIFAAGAVIGSAATWYYAKKKYERIAQEEIDSVKERFTTTVVNNYSGPQDSDEEKAQQMADAAREKPSVSDYAKKLSTEGYTNYSNSEIKVEEAKPTVTDIPFVIPPEEFGELEDEGYSKISLTYYADHILTDENDELIEDVEGTVGFDSLTHFGEYEDDSVFVRNNRLKVDYEILLDQRDYSEVLNQKPYLRGI